jgi:hypothetical protein
MWEIQIMDRTTRKRPSALMIVAMALGTAISGAVFAQQGLKEQILGTWTPVWQYVDQDGKRLEPFGPNPKGIAVYDGNGRFVLVLQRASLPRFASSNRMTGSPEENKAIVQGSIAYFGSYYVDEKEQKINIHYDGSTYPNWDGEDQARLISIKDDELSMVSPVSAVGGGSVHLLLRRAKPPTS